LGEANITVNKNTVPNDPQSPFVTSGLRIGSPAITTRGFKEGEAVALTHWICDILEAIDDDALLAEIKTKVIDLCQRHPVYKQL
jgi:glycine hydroxymethyltransferase